MKQPIGYTSRPAGDDPRSTEAWALGEASRRLALAAKASDDGASMREALRLNHRLWSIFQAALTEAECPLPREIRDNVLTLYVQVDRQIMARLADLDGTKITPILDINRSIAEGLATRSQGPRAPAASPPPAPGASPIMRVSA